ncbi:MAG: sugar kinase [Deltaproteobacteria bacterium]|nr:sugar kinase [Deltaproteobacteria bacterium]
MLAVVGTVPHEDFPLVAGEVLMKEETLILEGRRIPISRGTPALLAATISAGEVLGNSAPFAYLVGDIGTGKGSRRLYDHLTKHLPKMTFEVITFHYLQPDVDWHNRVLFALGEMEPKPVLIADAGFMYAAKMSGQAGAYDLFTPDVGELAFLADEQAPHPFYTRGFILHEENRVQELIERAYEHDNAAHCLLVKGKQDYIAARQGVLATVDEPLVETLEPVGGTGDTVTGIVSALVASRISVEEAALLASRVNRLAGLYADPTPATQVIEIIKHIPRAMTEILRERKTKIESKNAR